MVLEDVKGVVAGDVSPESWDDDAEDVEGSFGMECGVLRLRERYTVVGFGFDAMLE